MSGIFLNVRVSGFRGEPQSAMELASLLILELQVARICGGKGFVRPSSTESGPTSVVGVVTRLTWTE